MESAEITTRIYEFTNEGDHLEEIVQEVEMEQASGLEINETLKTDEEEKSELLVTYGTIMRNYENVLKTIKEIENLHKTFTRPPSKSLLKKITISSLRFRKFSVLFITITGLMCILTFLIFEDRERSFPFIVIKNLFGDTIILKGVLCCFIFPHSWCFGSTPMILSNYYTWHFEYSLKMLKEQMEIRRVNKTGHVHTLDTLDCSMCQSIIQNDLKYFLKQYTRINSAIVFYIDIVKWRFLAIATAGAYFMATSLFYILPPEEQHVPASGAEESRRVAEGVGVTLTVELLSSATNVSVASSRALLTV
uniref:Uncharacterized protein LOC114334280 n=1 Tax=Diabrotica virgifera virgifera TaxID=50390 RepID=A0A6P7G583_DIAVI